MHEDGVFACGPGDPINPDGPEAADEIERLRALNAKLLTALKHARALMSIPDQFVDEVIIEAEGSEK